MSNHIQEDNVTGTGERVQTYTVLRFGVVFADELREGLLEVSSLQVSTVFCVENRYSLKKSLKVASQL